MQVRRADLADIFVQCDDAGLSSVHEVARLNTSGTINISRGKTTLFSENAIALRRIWSETTYQMQKLRDNPACAQQEFDRTLDAKDPGLHAKLTYDLNENVAPALLKSRPKMAILREQGVNGQVEMAAAFDRAGFAAVDVHMSDIISGRVKLADFKGVAACGGFSYGDVLGAGEGWAKSILFNPRARDEFEAFFKRNDTFALGVCNGCQMMSNLHEIIPGAEHWAHFARNQSEQFEARFVMVEVQQSPSILFDGMAGSRMPIVVSHGEGYADFGNAKKLQSRATAGHAALCRPQRQGHRDLSAQPQRLAARHHRTHHAGRALQHHDAAPRARVPCRAELLVSARVAGERRMAAHVPECAEVGGVRKV